MRREITHRSVLILPVDFSRRLCHKVPVENPVQLIQRLAVPYAVPGKIHQLLVVRIGHRQCDIIALELPHQRPLDRNLQNLLQPFKAGTLFQLKFGVVLIDNRPVPVCHCQCCLELLAERKFLLQLLHSLVQGSGKRRVTIRPPGTPAR